MIPVKAPSKVKRSIKEINQAIDAESLDPPETRRINRNRRLGKGALRVLFNHGDDLVPTHDKMELVMSEKMEFEEPPQIYTEGSSRPQCLPTSTRYYTIPHERYETSDNCPAYAPLTIDDDGNPAKKGIGAGCCTIRPYDDDGYKFLRYLARSVNRVSDLDAGRRALSPDLLEWLEQTYGTTEAYSPIAIDPNVPYVNVLLHFFFITKPMFDVYLGTVSEGRHMYDPEESWVLNANDTELLRLSKTPGVNGALTYKPLSTTPIYTPIPLKSSRYVIDVGLESFVDVTNIADFFSSDECGFRGRMEIVVYGQGVVSKRSSFYEVVLSVIQAMPDHNCVFQMGIDIGEILYDWGFLALIDETHTRLHGVRDIFRTYSDRSHFEVMQELFMPLRVDLPTKHRERDHMATGGAVGSYSGTLHPDIGYFFDPMAPLHPRDNYSLHFEAGYERDQPYLRITKTMLTAQWHWGTWGYQGRFKRVVQGPLPG